MTIMGWRPGGRGPLGSLQEMRRVSYEHARTNVAAEIARRRAANVPLDDDTDWAAEEARAEKVREAARKRDVGAYRGALEEGLMRTRGLLLELPAYKEDPRIDGLHVRLRSISQRRWLETVGVRQQLQAELDALGEAGDRRRMMGLRADMLDAQAELVRAAVVEVRGLTIDGTDWAFEVQGDALMPEEALDVLIASGLLEHLFVVARDFQVLDPLARAAYGLPQPPTSPSSPAGPAGVGTERCADAMAGRGWSGFAGPSSSPTPVLAAMPYADRGSEAPSRFGGPSARAG